MIRVLDIKNVDQGILIDLLLEYTERCTTSFRGSTLTEQEYRDYKEAIETLADEIRRRQAVYNKFARNYRNPEDQKTG
jgi:hypothetical protein